MRPTLETFVRQHREQLTPEMKQILLGVSNDVIELAYAAFEAGLEASGFNINNPNAWIRQREPALAELSDEALNAALDVACCAACAAADNYEPMADEDTPSGTPQRDH